MKDIVFNEINQTEKGQKSMVSTTCELWRGWRMGQLETENISGHEWVSFSFYACDVYYRMPCSLSLVDSNQLPTLCDAGFQWFVFHKKPKKILKSNSGVANTELITKTEPRKTWPSDVMYILNHGWYTHTSQYLKVSQNKK